MSRRIGILTYRGERGFVEPVFLRHLVQEGKRLGAEVFLFGPQDVDVQKRRIRGCTLGRTGWKSGWYSWPDIVIDRYRYYPVPKHQRYLPFRRQALFRYANSRFSNKFRVHQVLEQDPVVRKWLPQTVAFSLQALAEMLGNHRIVYLKPTNGTGGRSILRVVKLPGGYLLQGRTRQQLKSSQKLGTLADLGKRLEHWMEREKLGKEEFFLQQGLDLSLLPGRTVDARMLVQKDGTGEWKITGIGMRMGPRQSSTSNLHGGGKALHAVSFLVERFGEARAREILQECREMALCTVRRIEEHYGPMMEFGFDVGIDVRGNIWLIEMNPKPGREIFRQLGQKERYRLAVRRPLEYALYLLDKAGNREQGTMDQEQGTMNQEQGIMNQEQ